MKILLSIWSLCICTFCALNAQVLEDKMQMAYGQQNALIIEFTDADSKLVDKEWREFMKDYGRLKKVKKADEFVIEDAQIIDVGGVDRIDVYSRIERMGKEGGRLITWFAVGSGYVNSESTPDAYVGATELLQRFEHRMGVRKIEIELEVEEKEMKKIDTRMTKLQKDNEKYHKEIEKCKERITTMEENITKNLEEQELAQKEIEMQTTVLDAIKERLEKKKAQKSQ